MPRQATSTRGRPLKFGRATQLVTVTLPKDVVAWLATIDDDLAWALVKLHERSVKASHARQFEVAGLVRLPGGRALILVRPDFFSKLKGVSLIPLTDGRAFLALDSTKGVADLELALLDRLEAPRIGARERAALGHLRGLLQQWRQRGIHFESRSIIVAKQAGMGLRPRPLPPVG